MKKAEPLVILEGGFETRLKNVLNDVLEDYYNFCQFKKQ
mgnify:CR=1 FL=1